MPSYLVLYTCDNSLTLNSGIFRGGGTMKRVDEKWGELYNFEIIFKNP